MGILDGLTSKFSGSGAGVMNAITGVLLIMVVSGVIIGIVYYVNRQRKFDTLAPVISDRSGSRRFFLDYASYSKDKRTNLWDFRLKYQKETLMPPPDECMLVGSHGKNVAIMYQNSGGEIYPCKLITDKPIKYEEIENEITLPDGSVKKVTQKVALATVKVIEPDIALWSTQMDEKLISTYGRQSWWDKYGNQVMFFGAAVLTLALIFLVLKKIDVVEEAARLFSEATQTLKASSVQLPSNAP